MMNTMSSFRQSREAMSMVFLAMSLIVMTHGMPRHGLLFTESGDNFDTKVLDIDPVMQQVDEKINAPHSVNPKNAGVDGWCKNVVNELNCKNHEPCRYEDEVDLRVIVMAFDRAASLGRALASLDSLVLDGDTASLEIWLDCGVDGKYHGDVYQVAQSFNWSQGSTRVHVWPEHASLHGQWIDTWAPWSEDTKERVLFVEDDIDISPYAWRWIKKAKEHYEVMPSLAAISLKDDDYKDLQKHVKDSHSYLRRHSLPWGLTVIPRHWMGFQKWYHEMFQNRAFEPFIPGFDSYNLRYVKIVIEQAGMTERSTRVWTQWFHYYMYDNDLLSVFPNARATSKSLQVGIRGFEYNRFEEGLHYSGLTRKFNKNSLIMEWNEAYVNFPDTTVCIGYDGRIYKRIHDRHLKYN